VQRNAPQLSAVREFATSTDVVSADVNSRQLQLPMDRPTPHRRPLRVDTLIGGLACLITASGLFAATTFAFNRETVLPPLAVIGFTPAQRRLVIYSTECRILLPTMDGDEVRVKVPGDASTRSLPQTRRAAAPEGTRYRARNVGSVVPCWWLPKPDEEAFIGKPAPPRTARDALRCVLLQLVLCVPCCGIFGLALSASAILRVEPCGWLARYRCDDVSAQLTKAAVEP